MSPCARRVVNEHGAGRPAAVRSLRLGASREPQRRLSAPVSRSPTRGGPMKHDPRPHEAPTEELASADEGQMRYEPGGSVRAALANAMVRMKKQYYGRGPTAAKAWILDDYVF